MPRSSEQLVSADVFLVRPGGAGASYLTREIWRREEVSLPFLRAYARERWGEQAFVLHDGGLSAGRAEVTILLEASGGDERHYRTGDVVAPQLPRARPWQQAGWYARTLRWLREQLASNGEELKGELAQVSTYDLGCVVHAPTSKGGVYLKATETPYEALVTQQLARWRPGSLPKVLAVDEERALLLTRAAGIHLAESDDMMAWEKAVTELALLHRGEAPDALEDLGAPTYEFAHLPPQISELLLDGRALENWGLREDAIEGLAGLVPKLEFAHSRIADLGLPLCLTHGDAHPMNALVGSRGVFLFDWHEAGTAHPFTDAGWFFAWLSHPSRASLPVRNAHPDAVARLWLRYLEALGARGAAGLLDDAIRVALAHRAVVFDARLRIWEGTVPGWRPGYVPYYLRWLHRYWS